MEFASSLSSVPPIENLRRGQRAVVEKFIQSAIGSKPTVIAKLPTGYGKTKAAAYSFAALKARGEVDYLLFVVSRAVQSKQALGDIPDEVEGCGLFCGSCDFGYSAIAAHNALKDKTANVFVLTIQTLSTPTRRDALLSLMSKGRWMIVVDEYHHYGEDKKWTEWLKTLPHAAFLAMSATPDRDGERSPFGEPNVSVAYLDALEEKAVKPLSLHAYDYKINAIKNGGEVISFSISDLQEGGTRPEDIDRTMASKGAKWLPDFISPLVREPIARLNALAMYGIRAQMIIQALSCTHAKFVCEQVQTLLTEGMSVDWVGTGPNGRTDEENARILERFCPDKNPETNKREWSLTILVNVGMAGEGLDTTDVTEVVFLTNPHGTISERQTMGRAARIMKLPERVSHAVIGTINVDAGCDLSKFIGKNIMKVFDDPRDLSDINDTQIEPVEPRDQEYQKIEWDRIMTVLQVDLINIKQDPEYLPLLNIIRSNLIDQKFSEWDAVTAARKVLEDHFAKKASKNISANAESLRQQVFALTKHVLKLCLKTVISKRGRDNENSLPAEVSKMVNVEKAKRCGSVVNCSAEQLQKHIDWLKNLETVLLEGKAPLWLR